MAAPKLRDVRKLADSRAVFDLDVALTALPNLPANFVAGGGWVKAHLEFGREQGFAIARVELQAQLMVTCQRCLGAMPLRIHTHSPVLIVESEQEADGAPAGWETFLAPEGRLVPEALIAEELLLALPIVPLHEQASECEPLADGATEMLPPAQAAAAATTAVGPGSRGSEDAGSVDAAATAAAPTPQPPAAQATVRPFSDLRALLERAGKPRGGGA